MDYHILPTINALLNTLSTLLLLLGYRAIRRKNIIAHYRYMWSALGTSTLFLISYLTYHTLRQINEGIGHTSFMLEGLIRYLYYTILFSHRPLDTSYLAIRIYNRRVGLSDALSYPWRARVIHQKNHLQRAVAYIERQLEKSISHYLSDNTQKQHTTQHSLLIFCILLLNQRMHFPILLLQFPLRFPNLRNSRLMLLINFRL